MRGRDIAGVIEQYTKFVKPAFDTFVAPSRKHADVIIPWGRRAPRWASSRVPSQVLLRTGRSAVHLFATVVRVRVCDCGQSAYGGCARHWTLTLASYLWTAAWKPGTLTV